MKTYNICGEIKIQEYKKPKTNNYKIIMIYNEKGEHFVFGVEICQQCCEQFSYSIPCDFYSRNGAIITIIEDEDFKGLLFDDDSYSVKVQIEDASNPENKIVWNIQNNHNGYYAHHVYLNKDGKYIWEEYL